MDGAADHALDDVPVGEVWPGDRLLVKPGDVVPVDGLVVGTTAVLDEAALTGEAELVGGDDPTATMSRGHAEIAHLTRLLERLLADLGPDGPDAEDLPDLRRVLYGLHAILRLHFAQEEEAYLPLFERHDQHHGVRAG